MSAGFIGESLEDFCDLSLDDWIGLLLSGGPTLPQYYLFAGDVYAAGSQAGDVFVAGSTVGESAIC